MSPAFSNQAIIDDILTADTDTPELAFAFLLLLADEVN